MSTRDFLQDEFFTFSKRVLDSNDLKLLGSEQEDFSDYCKELVYASKRTLTPEANENIVHQVKMLEKKVRYKI